MIKKVVHRSLEQLVSSRYNRVAISVNTEGSRLPDGGYYGLLGWHDKHNHEGLIERAVGMGPQSGGDILWVPNGLGGTYLMYDHSINERTSAYEYSPECLSKIWKHIVTEDARGEVWVPQIFGKAQESYFSFGSFVGGLGVIAESDGEFNVFFSRSLDSDVDPTSYFYSNIDTDENLEDNGFGADVDRVQEW